MLKRYEVRLWRMLNPKNKKVRKSVNTIKKNFFWPLISKIAWCEHGLESLLIYWISKHDLSTRGSHMK